MIKIENIRLHQGVQIGAEVLSNLDKDRNGCEIFLGVVPDHYLVKGLKSNPYYIIPLYMVQSARPEPSSIEEFLKQPKLNSKKQ